MPRCSVFLAICVAGCSQLPNVRQCGNGSGCAKLQEETFCDEFPDGNCYRVNGIWDTGWWGKDKPKFAPEVVVLYDFESIPDWCGKSVKHLVYDASNRDSDQSLMKNLSTMSNLVTLSIDQNTEYHELDLELLSGLENLESLQIRNWHTLFLNADKLKLLTKLRFLALGWSGNTDLEGNFGTGNAVGSLRGLDQEFECLHLSGTMLIDHKSLGEIKAKRLVAPMVFDCNYLPKNVEILDFSCSFFPLLTYKGLRKYRKLKYLKVRKEDEDLIRGVLNVKMLHEPAEWDGWFEILR